VWLRKKTSAERRKMTAFQGIFRSEGTRDGRGQQQHLIPPVAANEATILVNQSSRNLYRLGK